MRSEPPHPLIRFRFVLLGVAIAAWAVCFAVLSLFKGSPSFPVAPVVGASGIVFVWTNIAYFWLELRYPHIKLSTGQYVSRAEQASRFMRTYSSVFFVFCGLIAVLITIACLRVAVGT